MGHIGIQYSKNQQNNHYFIFTLCRNTTISFHNFVELIPVFKYIFIFVESITH